MPNLPKKLIGNSPYAIAFNQLLDFFASLRPAQGVGVLTQHTIGGVIRTAQTKRPTIQQPKTGIATFQIHSQAGDYYICYPWNGSTWDSANPVNVAKPLKLRNSIGSEAIGGVTYSYSYGGAYITRTATWPTSLTESQVVVPAYITNDLIIAAQTNYTGSTDAPIWIDTNVDARAWMRAYS